MHVTLFDPVVLLPTRRLKGGALVLWTRRQGVSGRRMLPLWRVAAQIRAAPPERRRSKRRILRRILRYRGRE